MGSLEAVGRGLAVLAAQGRGHVVYWGHGEGHVTKLNHLTAELEEGESV